MIRRPPHHGLAVTRWFDGTTTAPGQPGVYERDIPLAPYSYWTSTYWCMGGETAHRARLFANQESLVQDVDWRGLAEVPKP